MAIKPVAMQWNIEDFDTDDFKDYLRSRNLLIGEQPWSPLHCDKEIICECVYFDNMTKKEKNPMAAFYNGDLYEIFAVSDGYITRRVEEFNRHDLSKDIEHFRKHYKSDIHSPDLR